MSPTYPAGMEKEALPRYSFVDEFPRRRRRRHGPPRIIKVLTWAVVGYLFYNYWNDTKSQEKTSNSILSTDRLHADYAVCSELRSVPKHPSGPRERSARYVDGHNAVLIRNATVWIGEPAAGTTAEEARLGKGFSWERKDVLLEAGLIKRVELGIKDSELPEGCSVYEARGRQLTAGIVDMHSHTGVESLPQLVGSSDGNELSSDITPFVRSIDGLNPLDIQIQTIKSGGVTTSLILPGSGNNMGGEAYVIKHAVGKPDGRTEISAEDMLADPDRNWRYMKMACGENPKSVYGKVGRDFGPFSRLGEAWQFRHAFEQASALVKSQDDWCNAAASIGAENMQSYLPQELKWESLGALLRGQVLLNTHCYTPLDMEAFVRHTNEFNFSVRAFHHAHGSYLIPEVLKRAYGGRPPAAALFADFMYYKAESYVASEQAGKILWENGITPVYVSDNPVINAQHVVFEAAKAYRNGLPYHVALAGVTSASAEILGLGERLGKVKAGFDADVVVWDSDPLSVGAAPVQVWIDGTAQFENPVELQKPMRGPIEPDSQLQDIKERSKTVEDVVFRNVSRSLIPGTESWPAGNTAANVVVRQGSIVCTGSCEGEIATAETEELLIVTLNDGYLAPTLTAAGTSLGLVEIEGEEVAQDGANSDDSFSRALDGLTLGGKNLRAAFSRGVTKSVSAPTYQDGLFKGLSVGFSTGANNSLEKGAVWQDEVALHYSLAKSSKTPSLSSGVGELRRKLEEALSSNATGTNMLEDRSIRKVVSGRLPLAISVHSADHIAAVLRLKHDVEAIANASTLRMVIIGGAESHMLADELAEAKVGVILAPMLPFGEMWDHRRALIGAPTTNGTAIDALHAAGVKVVLGTSWNYQARDLYLAAGIAYANGGGKISEKDALAIVSSNVYDMFGLNSKDEPERSFAVFEGHPLEIDGRVRAVADGRGKVEVWS